MLSIMTKLGLPANFSVGGGAVDEAIVWSHILMAVLFLFWAPFFIYTLIRFRQSKNSQASHHGMRSHFSTYMEGGVAVFEIALLFAFAFPVWESRIDDVPKESEAVVARIVAQQFKWNIHYPGPDGKFGRTDASLMNDQELNFVGLDHHSEFGEDDIIPTQNHLHLPVDKKALLYLSTKDVIHSFSIPVMRVKQDAIPGMRIPVWFEPTQTGSWEIACAQLCGNSHYEMKGYVHIHTQKGYDGYMEALSIIQEVDDYDFTFEAESVLEQVISALKEGYPSKAEELAFNAKSLAEEARDTKEEEGGDDDWDW